MTVSELLVGVFALLFLAFCLTAIALIALSKDKDEVAKESLNVLRTLQPAEEEMKRPSPPPAEDDPPPPC